MQADAGAGAGPEGRAPARPRGRLDRFSGGIVAVLAVAVLVGLGVGVAAHQLAQPSSPPTPIRTSSSLRGQATWAAGARPAPAITALRDQSGERFSLASLRGRSVTMVFFDSHCKQQCPLAGRALAAAEQPLTRAQRPVLVVVSVNPLDTPASARAAARAWGLAGLAPWHWLMGSHATLAPVWRAYHIFVAPTKGDITHTEALYLIDRQGDERSGYLYPYVPSFVTHDLRVLAGSRAGAGPGRA